MKELAALPARDSTLRLPQARSLCAIAIASWLFVVALQVWWPTVPHWPLRVGLALLAATTLRHLWKERPQLLLSPLLILPAIIVTFYSVLPAAYLSLDLFPHYIRPLFRWAVEKYPSSLAELIVLQFASSLLVIVLALHVYLPAPSPTERTQPSRSKEATTLFILIALVALLTARSLSPELQQWMQSGIGRQIADGAPPALSLCIAVLIWLATQDRSWRFISVSAAGVGCAALFTFFNAKPSAFIAVSSLLLWLTYQRYSLRRLWWSAVSALGVISISVLALAELRAAPAEAGPPPGVADVIVGKLLARQTETLGCFSNAVDRRLLAPPQHSPLYFVSAVVPRVLWSGKPNLSQGDLFATDYCDMDAGSVSGGGSVHSASVTLLGEPVIAAGLGGLIVAQLSLMISLGLLSMLCLRSGAIGTITLTALLPWLADFDQSLALYFAGAVKAFLYISPGVFLLAWSDRRTG